MSENLDKNAFISSTPGVAGLDRTQKAWRSTPAPTTERDIFTRDISGELIEGGNSDIMEIIYNAHRLTHRLNSTYHSKEEVRAIFSEITGQEIDETTLILPPFYVDFGRNIRVGEKFLYESKLHLYGSRWHKYRR